DRSDAGELPATRALTAQYLFLYTLSGGADDFDTLLDSTHRIAKVRLLVHEDSTRYGERLIALAQEQVARTFPPGYRVRYSGTLEDALGRALMTSGKAVLFVSSAIAFGYATLCLSGFGLHVQLGSLVALAMLVSSGSALVLLPAVVARFRPAFLWGGFIIEGRERATQGAAVTA